VIVKPAQLGEIFRDAMLDPAASQVNARSPRRTAEVAFSLSSFTN
jgi:hypothetical protein